MLHSKPPGGMSPRPTGRHPWRTTTVGKYRSSEAPALPLVDAHRVPPPFPILIKKRESKMIEGNTNAVATC